jgi:hypothetical protein
MFQCPSVQGWWHDVGNISPPPPWGTVCLGEHFTYAARRNGQWRPSSTPLYHTELGFTVLSRGLPTRVSVRYSKPTHAKGAQITAGCQQAEATVSETSSFATVATVGGGVNQDEGGLEQQQHGGSLTLKKDFGVIEVAGTYSYANTKGTTWNTSRQSNWSDMASFTKEFRSSARVPPGSLAVPVVEAAVFEIFGLHNLRSVYPRAGVVHPSDPGPGGFRLHRGPVSGNYLGEIRIPASEAPGLAGTRGLPIWYLEQPAMTVAQYQRFCAADIRSGKIAPTMKAALCRAGVQKPITCK